MDFKRTETSKVSAWRVLNGYPESAEMFFDSEEEMSEYFQENGISNAAYDWQRLENEYYAESN